LTASGDGRKLRAEPALRIASLSTVYGAVSLIAVVAANAATARAQPARSETAFVYFGEPDPSGVDQSFLALARRRGAPIARETPGQLAELPHGAALARAVEEYSQLHFKEAIAALDALEREVVPRGGGGLTQGELVDLHAYRAAARTAVGDEAGAWDDLLAAAVLAPSRPLDPARFSPRVVEAARRAAQALGAPAKLAIDVAPDDALIIVDGQLLGRGRVELSLPVGAHLVRAERSGFQSAGRLFELKPEGGAERLTLRPADPPTPEQLAARAAQLDARRALAAFLVLEHGQAFVELELVDVRSVRVLAHARLADDARLTTGDLGGMIDALLGSLPDGAERPSARPKPPWYRRPLVWGLVGGALAAAALGVGLGVGLSGGREPGFAVHVNLGSVR
jgi:PEGA domain